MLAGGRRPGAAQDVTHQATVDQVAKMCPSRPVGSIKKHLPRSYRRSSSAIGPTGRWS